MIPIASAPRGPGVVLSFGELVPMLSDMAPRRQKKHNSM